MTATLFAGGGLILLIFGAEKRAALERARQLPVEQAPVAAVLRWVPLALLNLQYRLFARIRYRLFGQAKGCIVPTEQERRRFLA